MKFETKIINFFAGCLQIPIPAALIALIGELQQAANGGKVLEVEIKIKRKRRSLNANAYLWEVLGRMAAVLKTDKDSVYLMMLDGVLSEAAQLGIETLSEADKDLMLKEWGAK